MVEENGQVVIGEMGDAVTRMVAAAFRIPVSWLSIPPGQLGRAMEEAAKAEERALVESYMAQLGQSPLHDVIPSLEREELSRALDLIKQERKSTEGG